MEREVEQLVAKGSWNNGFKFLVFLSIESTSIKNQQDSSVKSWCIVRSATTRRTTSRLDQLIQARARIISRQQCIPQHSWPVSITIRSQRCGSITQRSRQAIWHSRSADRHRTMRRGTKWVMIRRYRKHDRLVRDFSKRK